MQLLQNPHHFNGLAPQGMAEIYGRWRMLRFRLETWMARRTARRSKIVCTVSDSLAEAVRHEWPEVAAKVTVVKNVLPDDPPPARLPVDPASYCLFVANDSPHKHWDDVMAAFRAHEGLPMLVVVGQPRSGRSVERLDVDVLDRRSQPQPVITLGAIHDRATIRWLYAHAAVVLVSSSSETFGLTLMEALAYNGRIAASDLPAHREVARGFAVHFFAPCDWTGMVTAVKSALENDSAPTAELLQCHSALGAALKSAFVTATERSG